MLTKILTASLLTATATLGTAAPALATSPASSTVGTTLAAAPTGDEHTIGKCSPQLLFDSNKLTCDYAGLFNPEGP